jgi:hypothetical protein
VAAIALRQLRRAAEKVEHAAAPDCERAEHVPTRSGHAAPRAVGSSTFLEPAQQVARPSATLEAVVERSTSVPSTGVIKVISARRSTRDPTTPART